jgi:uncharacterized protein (DUF433 family)
VHPHSSGKGTAHSMTTDSASSEIIRTERGLSVGETRITLYDLMDYITHDWPTEEIRDLYPQLTDEQFNAAMDYIAAHREEVEAEYQIVLQQAAENRRYWEERNRERFAEIAALPPRPGSEKIRAKLAEWKARLAEENCDGDARDPR